MKRIAAIFLLGLLLFNWVGYQLYTAVLQEHANNSLIADLDQNNYADADLLLIKVPATHISSYANSKEFQRVDGKIEIAGIQYNYVKRRFNEGSLELLCIPNKMSTRLQSAKNEFFKLVNDLQQPGQSKKSEQQKASFKGFTAEYCATMHPFSIPDMTLVKGKAIDHFLVLIPNVNLTLTGQPPDFA